eukprot:scaffold55477_cov57-Attheya_sp.AAC.2
MQQHKRKLVNLTIECFLLQTPCVDYQAVLPAVLMQKNSAEAYSYEATYICSNSGMDMKMDTSCLAICGHCSSWDKAGYKKEWEFLTCSSVVAAAQQQQQQWLCCLSGRGGDGALCFLVGMVRALRGEVVERGFVALLQGTEQVGRSQKDIGLSGVSGFEGIDIAAAHHLGRRKLWSQHQAFNHTMSNTNKTACHKNDKKIHQWQSANKE